MQRKHEKLAIIPPKQCRACGASYRPSEPDHRMCARCYAKYRLHSMLHRAWEAKHSPPAV